MPSYPKIPKETILSAALEMLIEDGYNAITIKTLSNKLGCSTQPISWHFGSMEGLRKALAEAAYKYASEKTNMVEKNIPEEFEKIGLNYIDMAIDEPNLVKFIFAESGGSLYNGQLINAMSHECNRQILSEMSDAMEIDYAHTEKYMTAMVTYTHGLAMLIASGILKDSKEELHRRFGETGVRFMISYGVAAERADMLFKKSMKGQSSCQ